MLSILTFITGATGTEVAKPSEYTIRNVGNLENIAIDEASGMAISYITPDLIWVVNDGQNGSLLHAIDTRGSNKGKVKVNVPINYDWEDLTSFKMDGIPYILVADIGDNRATRDSYTLYVFEEQKIIDRLTTKSANIKPAWQIDFTYEDGPLDSESVAVDTEEKRIYLISKRTLPPVLYELPLKPSDPKKTQVAKRKTELHGIPRPNLEMMLENPLYGIRQSWPTAMDISPDTKTSVILTYRNIYVYHRPSTMTWPEVFAGKPASVLKHSLFQAESITFDQSGRNFYITSELVPSPLLKVERNEIENIE